MQIHMPEKELAEISKDLGTTFDGAVESISAIRSSASEVASSLGLLQTLEASNNASSSQDRDSFAAFSAHAERAAGAAEEAASELDGAALQSGLRALSQILAELKRNTVELAAISSLTKIAKTESPDVADRLSVFTETLDRRFRDLRQSSTEAASIIDAIRSESGDARETLVAIAAELRRISTAARRDAAELETLRQAHLAQMERMASDSRILGDHVQKSVARVIACLQFPDSFAQRIEHVRTMLGALEEGRPDAEKRVIATLAAAHLDAMADSLVIASDDAVSALGSIPSLREEGSAELLGRSEGDASCAWIAAEAHANEVMIDTVAASRNRLDAAVSLISRIIEEVDAARALLEGSRRQNQELNISVHNASIVASRSSSSASPLHVLADGVKSVVGQVSRSVARIFEELARIRSASQALQRTQLAAELDMLGRIQELAAMKANEDSVRLARAREARQQLAKAADRLSAAATNGRSKFETARRFSDPIRIVAVQLRERFPATEPGDCDLAWIETLYTMNEERAVHAEAVAAMGLTTAAAKPAQQPEAEPVDADLDDFLL